MTPLETIRALADGLLSLSMVEVKTSEALLADAAAGDPRTAVTARFLARSATTSTAFRADAHHDITPDIFVHDPSLFTLGLVHLVPDTMEGSAEAVERLVDQAAYLRQLCLFGAENSGTAAYTVELVLVFRREHADAARAIADAMTRLRELARETGYLRALGVDILCEAADGFTNHSLRRAFPWALAATRRWFNTTRVKDHADAAAATAPWRLDLANYRNAPERAYLLAGEDAGRSPGVHLLHGYNGAGKTTFTEAFELLLTGRVDRIGDPAKSDYYTVIRHRARRFGGTPPPPDQSDPSVTLRVGNLEAPETTATVTVVQKATDDPTDTGVRPAWDGRGKGHSLSDPASFRLDQVLMDSLIRSDAATRATRFLRAFFPADQPRFTALATATAGADRAIEKLPAALRSQLASLSGGTEATSLLQWAETPEATWAARGILTTLAPALPVSPEQLELLGHVEPSLGALLKHWKEKPETFTNAADELAKLDNALDLIRGSIADRRAVLETSSRFFHEFAEWECSRNVDRGPSLEYALNKWLELQAAADLAARWHDVASTLADARAGGWQAAAAHEDLFREVPTDPSRIAILKEQREALAHARDHARAVVHDWGVAADTSAQSGKTGAPPRQHLSSVERDSLNRVCQWLPSLDDGPDVPRLGDMVTAALDSGEPNQRGSCQVGKPHGLMKADDESHAVLAALDAIESGHVSVAAAVAACREARIALAEAARLKKEASDSFFSQLASNEGGANLLGDALHELLALFKPAPWAYQEIVLRAALRGSGEQAQSETLGFVADNLPAELRLNTAEMNTFTLALFLLCAPALDNPLRLLVLDDPLQNMDEMTVNSLARGLGKLVRIFPRGWRLIALFHAEEDLHRIRAEVPAAVYRLPWLNPGGGSEAAKPVGTVAEENTFTRGPQPIRTLIAVAT